ncbi:UBP-type zinc finger domain-containing protein [Pseudonocardia sp. H11422]|uniref:UBP-type zinc finger domain-containing protein n=1 Tax=Pseudonocardia sp. H11422 TaxID=2835866 RepID=UPI0027E2F1FE|nr:UBP-type zinc finger domain-containing protein [Pseudonocardia sp. H11422]
MTRLELPTHRALRRPRLDRARAQQPRPLRRLRADGLGDLRLCLTCGNVGCCDSTPQRHATRHYQNSGHPVMRSFEPGESWRWCYIDERIV